MNASCYEKLRIAYEKSDEIIQNIQYSPKQMIDTSVILDYVRAHYCPEIELFSRSFAGLSTSYASACDCGAMMRIDFQNHPRAAIIVLNSDMPPAFQRFCLMQQIGHLVTIPSDAKLNPDNYNVSTHINYDLTKISAEELENNYFLMREQVANIFALRVLMPGKQFYQKMRELDSVWVAAEFFGVTEDAVISRMMIGE